MGWTGHLMEKKMSKTSIKKFVKDDLEKGGYNVLSLIVKGDNHYSLLETNVMMRILIMVIHMGIPRLAVHTLRRPVRQRFDPEELTRRHRRERLLEHIVHPAPRLDGLLVLCL